MKIKYHGSEKYPSDKRFGIGYFENDESDYFFSITLFRREWVWFVWK